jgi:hypothetical protein
MSNVEFEQDVEMAKLNRGSSYPQRGPTLVNNYTPPHSSGMVGWLIEKGILKNETQAKTVLLLAVIINFTIATILVTRFLI